MNQSPFKCFATGTGQVIKPGIETEMKQKRNEMAREMHGMHIIMLL